MLAVPAAAAGVRCGGLHALVEAQQLRRVVRRQPAQLLVYTVSPVAAA